MKEKEIRSDIRHELCHVLDILEGKIDCSIKGFNRPKNVTLEQLRYAENMNRFIKQTYRAYTDYLMAKRFIKIYDLDYFKVHNENGMEKFLRNVVNCHTSEWCLWVYSMFPEAIKTSFYSKDDDRFPTAIWKIVDWLCDDFDYIESLKV